MTAGHVPATEGHPLAAALPRIEIVRAVDGPAYRSVLEIRRRVFAEEQGIVETQVLDPDDQRSLVLLAVAVEPGPAGPTRTAVATGRVTLNFGTRGEALIAWVATLPEARRRGVATALVRDLLRHADERRAPSVVLAAQQHAEGLYRRLGFVPVGESYKVRDIPHRWMVRQRP